VCWQERGQIQTSCKSKVLITGVIILGGSVVCLKLYGKNPTQDAFISILGPYGVRTEIAGPMYLNPEPQGPACHSRLCVHHFVFHSRIIWRENRNSGADVFESGAAGSRPLKAYNGAARLFPTRRKYFEGISVLSFLLVGWTCNFSISDHCRYISFLSRRFSHFRHGWVDSPTAVLI